MNPAGALPARPRRAERGLDGDWVDPSCALCGARARRERFREGAHAVVECEGCRLVYVTPRRSARALLMQVYDEGYWRSARPRERGYADYLGDEERWLATWRRRFDTLAAHLPAPGRALDVGAAAGFASRVLAERGWRVSAVEPSEPARARLLESLGADALVGRTLDDAELAPASFELVTLFDVIEHLPDPLAALARARELLAPGGRLLLETQNVESRAARLLGRRWHHYKHAEHLLHFSPATLGRALAASDLALEALYVRGGGKYVAREFLVERSARLARWLPRVARPLSRLLPRTLWVDPRDELLVVARAAEER